MTGEGKTGVIEKQLQSCPDGGVGGTTFSLPHLANTMYIY